MHLEFATFDQFLDELVRATHVLDGVVRRDLHAPAPVVQEETGRHEAVRDAREEYPERFPDNYCVAYGFVKVTPVAGGIVATTVLHTAPVDPPDDFSIADRVRQRGPQEARELAERWAQATDDRVLSGNEARRDSMRPAVELAPGRLVP